MARNDVINSDGSINYNTIGGFKDRLDGHDTSLAQRVSKGELVVNVKDYGAKGDGIANDTQAFTNALAVTGNIYIPQGNYLINLNVTLSKFRIIGDGYNTILKPFTTGTAVIRLDSSINFIDTWSIENLTIDGNNKLSDGLFINATASMPITKGLVSHLRMNNVKKGIYGIGTMYNNGFRDISILGSTNGVYIDGSVLSGSAICYNTYDRIEVQVTGTNLSGNDGIAIYENGGNSWFRDCVTDSICKFTGQNTSIYNLMIEQISPTFSLSPNVQAIFLAGIGSVISATLQEIDNTKCNTGLILYGAPQTVLSLRTWGVKYPNYPIGVDSSATETVILNVDAAGGYTADQYISEAVKRGITCLNGNWMKKYAVRTVYGTAAPTTGTWAVGDRCYNNTPTVGQPKSWVCTVAGSPGTWVSEGNL